MPTLNGKLEGSFTQAGMEETLYSITIDNCSGSLPVWNPELVAIFSKDKKVFEAWIDPMEENEDAIFFGQPLRVVDLNQDKQNEILLMGGGAGQGISVETAHLLKVENQKLVYVKDFGTVYEDQCDAGFEQPYVLASVIYFSGLNSQNEPQFKIENFEKSCAEESEYKKSDKKFEE
ncbi:MAG: hypothetical protein HQM15_05865 [Deltaproteobacteria bacterium]|nr:hypothetical protein [Deltaproteobacteria bacterium]